MGVYSHLCDCRDDCSAGSSLKDMKIADVFIGYGDEFKEVQYKPYAVCKWKKCSVVGIYMDQLFIVASDTVWRGYRY